MEELRKEIRMKGHLRMKIVGRMKVVGRRLRWAGHIQRMSEERLIKRAWKIEEGGRIRGRNYDGGTVLREIPKGQR